MGFLVDGDKKYYLTDLKLYELKKLGHVKYSHDDFLFLLTE